LANNLSDREDALRDDFTLEGHYDYGDEDEWAEEEANWTGEEEAQAEEAPEGAKDESKAYLEFLNEEVSRLRSDASCRC
jgi:hypothetical protein